jgi:hypothetical protein
MHLLHHAAFSYAQSQNSSKYVVPCIFCETYITIEIHGHFWTSLHNHLTKSNVDPYVCYSPLSDCRTTKINVVCKLSHDTYCHLCRSDTPSIYFCFLFYYLAHAYMWYGPLCWPSLSGNIGFKSHFVVEGFSSQQNHWFIRQYQ